MEMGDFSVTPKTALDWNKKKETERVHTFAQAVDETLLTDSLVVTVMETHTYTQAGPHREHRPVHPPLD